MSGRNGDDSASTASGDSRRQAGGSVSREPSHEEVAIQPSGDSPPSRRGQAWGFEAGAAEAVFPGEEEKLKRDLMAPILKDVLALYSVVAPVSSDGELESTLRRLVEDRVSGLCSELESLSNAKAREARALAVRRDVYQECVQAILAYCAQHQLAIRPAVDAVARAYGAMFSDFTNLLHGLKFPDDAARHLGALPSSHVLAGQDPVAGSHMHEMTYSEHQSDGLRQRRKRYQVFLSNLTSCMYSITPIMTWLPRYRLPQLKGDLLGGLSVAFMFVPGAMAEAQLAGLPIKYGLYAGIVPPLVYMLFGTSRQLVIGPTAMISILVANGVGAVYPHTDEPDEVAQSLLFSSYLGAMLLVSLISGLMLVALGILRFGAVISNFMSKPMLIGFTSAAAIIIALNQVKHLFGLKIARTELFHDSLYYLLVNLNETQWQSVVLSICAFLIFLFCTAVRALYPRVGNFLPPPFIVVVLGIFFSWGLDLQNNGVEVVGPLDSRLSELPSPPAFAWSDFRRFLPLAAAIALIGYIESLSVARRIADLQNYVINPSQELIALGLGNIFGSFFSSYPVSASMSRSNLAYNSGTNTQLQTIVFVLALVITAESLGGLLQYLPVPVLAVIIIMAVYRLIELREFYFIFRVRKLDFVILIITFLSTLFIGIEQGVLIAIVCSFFFVMFWSSRPHIATLGRMPGSREYGDVEMHREALVTPGIVVMRFDSPLFFANAAFVKEKLKALEEVAEQHQERQQRFARQRARAIARNESVLMTGAGLEAETYVRTRCVVLVVGSVDSIDTSACHVLAEMWKEYRSRQIDLVLVSVKREAEETLTRFGLGALLKTQFATVQDAVDWYVSTHADASKTEAPAAAAAAYPVLVPVPLLVLLAGPGVARGSTLPSRLRRYISV
eukprot:m.71146 g.71146  ORF g.71146 m.71146 type:complete len:899 (-) comp12928_c0_seq2:1889-4585(-)